MVVDILKQVKNKTNCGKGKKTSASNSSAELTESPERVVDPSRGDTDIFHQPSTGYMSEHASDAGSSPHAASRSSSSSPEHAVGTGSSSNGSSESSSLRREHAVDTKIV